MRISDWSSDVCSSDLEERAVASVSKHEVDHYNTLPRSRPVGLTASMTSSTAKARADLYSDGRISTEHSSAMPMIMPPSTAPSTRPTPPRMVAANIGSSMYQPISDFSSVLMPRKKPAAAESTPMMVQVRMVVSRVSMPESCARSGLSDIARIALPQRV